MVMPSQMLIVVDDTILASNPTHNRGVYCRYSPDPAVVTDEAVVLCQRSLSFLIHPMDHPAQRRLTESIV